MQRPEFTKISWRDSTTRSTGRSEDTRQGAVDARKDHLFEAIPGCFVYFVSLGQVPYRDYDFPGRLLLRCLPGCAACLGFRLIHGIQIQ